MMILPISDYTVKIDSKREIIGGFVRRKRQIEA